MHVGFLINKFFIYLKKKYILSIGLDVVKDTILLNSTKSYIDVLDIDSLNILKIQKLMILWKFNKKLKYIPHDVFKYLNNLNNRYDRESRGRGAGKVGKRRYDCLLISQMDYIFTCHQLKKILENASSAKIKNIIIITPSVYTFSIKLSNLSHILSSYLSAISSFINRKKNSTITYRRRLGYFIRLISLNYNIKHIYSYVYPSGLIRMFMLQIKHIK